MSKPTLIIALLSLVIIVETGILLWKPDSIVKPFDDTLLREDIENKNKLINFWQSKSERLSKAVDSINVMIDSLEAIEPVIKHHYHEIYLDIPNASNAKLDSILRSNW